MGDLRCRRAEAKVKSANNYHPGNGGGPELWGARGEGEPAADGNCGRPEIWGAEAKVIQPTTTARPTVGGPNCGWAETKVNSANDDRLIPVGGLMNEWVEAPGRPSCRPQGRSPVVPLPILPRWVWVNSSGNLSP